ncbi:hypothetical protein HYV86_07450 [Candidatus Woesearchaeota archaeon]|nr:hypothetical protein [Candidatus Woesearchaeota archaeon]
MKLTKQLIIFGLVFLSTLILVTAVPPSLGNFMQLYGDVVELPENGPFTMIAQIGNQEFETPISNNKYGISPTFKVFSSEGTISFFIENSLGTRRSAGTLAYAAGSVFRRNFNYSSGEDIAVVTPPPEDGGEGQVEDEVVQDQDINPPDEDPVEPATNLSLQQKYANLTIDFEAIEDEYDDLKDDYLKAKDRNQTRDIVRTGEKIKDILDKDIDDLLEKINDLKDEADEANDSDIEDDVDNLKDDVTDLEKQIKELLGIKEEQRRVLTPTPPVTPPSATTCTYSWDCAGGFGACLNGVRYQTCRRIDDCDVRQRAGAQVITTPKPQEQQACQSAVTPPVREDAQSQVCTPYKKRCFGDDLQRCSSDGNRWDTIETCFTSCDAVTLSCEEETLPKTLEPSPDASSSNSWLLPLVGIIVLLGGMGAFFAFYVNQKKFAPLKEYITDSRLQGYSDSQIRSRVIGEGWDAQQVDKLLKK